MMKTFINISFLNMNLYQCFNLNDSSWNIVRSISSQFLYDALETLFFIEIPNELLLLL